MPCPCCQCHGACETDEDCGTGCSCVDGECVPTPPCSPCLDCDWPYVWPASLFEYGDEEECWEGGLGNTTSPSSKFQDIFQLPGGGGLPSPLPNGMTWNAGYPDVLSGCNAVLVVDSSYTFCCYENCTVNGQENQRLLGIGIGKFRYRVLVISCPDGPESATVLDLTSQAISGVTEFEVNYQPEGCPDPPIACTDRIMPIFYDDPVPDCNPFP